MRTRRTPTLGQAHWVARYGLAISSVVVALVLTIAVNNPLVRQIRSPLFIPAILVSAWYGGIGPGLLAVGLSMLAINYFLVLPRNGMRIVSVEDGIYLFVFAVSALLVTLLTTRQRRADTALRQAHDELTDQMLELELSTEQLQTETASRKQVETEVHKAASLLDLTHDTVFARDESDVITYWNHGAAELYGWSKEEAVGRVSHQLLQTIFPLPLEEIEALLHRTGRWEGEIVHTKRDGTRVVVASRWSAQRDDHGRPAGVLETNNDVSMRKDAEEALQRQANLLEQSHDAIFAWDFPGTIIYWSRGAQQLYGFSTDEAIGRVSHDLLRTQHPMSTRLFEATIEREGMWSGELTHTTRDGRQVVVDSRQVLMREAGGRRLVLETNRDITERRQAAEALQQSQSLLAHVTRVTMLGEITASIAHEVNQPLAAVVMNGNACLRWLAIEPPNLLEAREAAQRIVSDGNRAGQVIARVRALVKREPSEKSALNVNDVIADTLGFTRTEVARQGVSTRTELREDLPTVVGDRVQLQQVFVNLILNGIDAMSAVSERPRVLTIRSRSEHAGGVLVEVKDSGTGLGPGQSDHIFDPFFSTKPGGLGIGLSVTRSIVEQHGGRISAVPNDGPGVTMQVSLPAASGGAS
jgi:PAS domain S-box-containing protein